MVTIGAPPSLQRTSSAGHLNIHLLVQNKVNDDLLIIARDNLPPTLRNGKLVLNQKVTFRNEERQSVEGVIVYMNHNRENCVVAKNELLQKRKQKESSGNKSSDFSSISDSRITIGDARPKSVMKTSIQTQRQTKNNRSNKNSTTISSTSLSNDLYEDEDEDNDDVAHSSIEYSFSTTEPISNQEETMDTTLQNANKTSSIVVENSENEIYLQKINDLSTKVSEQAKVIKKLDAEIKQLRSTTIGIPSDSGAQNFVLHVADKIRQHTKTFKYQGNLEKDAKSLGLKVHQLNEILKSKGTITSIARELFKAIVPEDRRQGVQWNDLKEDVLIKETLLMNFLERYYGPIQVDTKKIHTSLVGCLRNERNSNKKQQEQSGPAENQDPESNETEHTLETTGIENLDSE